MLCPRFGCTSFSASTRASSISVSSVALPAIVSSLNVRFAPVRSKSASPSVKSFRIPLTSCVTSRSCSVCRSLNVASYSACLDVNLDSYSPCSAFTPRKPCCKSAIFWSESNFFVVISSRIDCAVSVSLSSSRVIKVYASSFRYGN